MERDESITYKASDNYAYPAKDYQHGIKLSDIITPEIVYGINQILPDTTYTNKFGYREKWQVKRFSHPVTSKQDYFLLFPQPLLEQFGTDFHSEFSFTVPAEKLGEYT